MANVWQVQLTAADRQAVAQLAERRRKLGLGAAFTEVIRAAVALAATASDDDLRRGEL